MELGEKLRSARLSAGLTQKQLSDGIVTRNMLSQIENGTAKPSMKTLEAFAERLNRKISFFLEDSPAASPNTRLVENARGCFDRGDWNGALEALSYFQQPDGVHDRERALLRQLCLLELAREAVGERKYPYARELLEKMGEERSYCQSFLDRERILLLGKLGQTDQLPSLDEELLLRAEQAISRRDESRAAALLDACEAQDLPLWQLLRGKCALASGDYARAAELLSGAETVYPEESAPLLEICFRELGDYKQAYLYACRQKK